MTAFLLYTAILGRDTVASELQNAIYRLKGKLSVNSLLAELVGSAEFAGIIE